MDSQRPPLERDANDVVWFGVGSMHFGYEKPPPFTLPMADYLRELKLSLDSISAVTNLQVGIDENVLNDGSFTYSENLGAFEDGAGHFPPIGVGALAFELHIPRRLETGELGTIECVASVSRALSPR